jgi:tetratricopeptide (TPR) repeat protein
MDFIDGRSFDQLIFEGELAPADIATLMAKVCRATAAAHARGVLHRDLKPANILVSGSEPWITDFGLARTTVADADVTRLTHSGEIIGTPAYMAPEQALGTDADERADVYSLGACLYEACVGQPPFGGDSVYGVLTRVLREPPPPLRQQAPHIPEPLERICLVALAKKPADRYASAAELAADLERFARGEPILARRPVNRAARRRWGIAAAAVVVLGGGALVTAWIATREGETQRDLDVVAKQLTTAEKAMQVSAAYMALVQETREPRQRLEAHWNGHWVSGEEGAALIAQVDAAADAVGARYPESRLPAAWKALARFLAEVDSIEGTDARLAALAETAAAAGEDPFPQLVYARAALAEYARELTLPRITASAAGVEVGELVESGRLREMREQAAAALARASRSAYWPHLRQGRTALGFTGAIASLQAKEYAAAAEALAALRDDPFLGGDAQRIQITTLFLAGEYEAAARAGEGLIRRGWLGAGLAVGRAWSTAAEVASLRGEHHPEWFERAIAAYTLDVERSRRPEAALVPRALCHIARARVQERRGDDPEAAARAAIADLQAALPKLADPTAALSARGNAWWVIGTWRERQGQDAAEPYRAAVADFREAARHAPDDPLHRTNIATLTIRLARVTDRAGGDPEPLLLESERDLDALSREQPRFAVVWLNLGSVRKELARLARKRRRDPLALYAGAIAATERALQENPRYTIAAHNLALLWVERARLQLAAKQAAEALEGFRRAIEVYGQALAVNPAAHDSIASRGVAHKAAADALVQLGRDSRADLEAAVRNYDDALALQPNDPPTWYNRGNALADLARLRAGTGEDVASVRALAAASYRKALGGRPGFWQAAYKLGMVLEEAGDARGAAAAYEETVKLRPDLEPQLAPRIRALRAR